MCGLMLGKSLGIMVWNKVVKNEKYWIFDGILGRNGIWMCDLKLRIRCKIVYYMNIRRAKEIKECVELGRTYEIMIVWYVVEKDTKLRIW